VNQPTASNDFSPRDARILARVRTVAAPAEPVISLHGPCATDREAIETRIADKFAQRYGAQIRHFLPYLVDLSVAGQIGAVAGLRPARDGALFLEQYFDGPVEQAVSRTYRTPVDREQIVEIGNLASDAPGAASLLFGMLPTLLARAGLRWVVCTATPQVRAMLDRLGFPTRTICRADPVVLGDGQRDWGSYYDSCPQVIVGDVNVALARIAASTTLRSLIGQQGTLLERAAATLRKTG
jgi:hypothetical protein